MTPPEGAMLEATSADTPTTDPVESFSLDDIQGNEPDESSEGAIPEANILGGARPEKKKPDATATETPATATVDGRDPATGKFTKKGEAAEAKPDAAVDADGKPVEAKPAEPMAFQYRAMNQTKDLPGATLNDAGDLTVPAAKVADIRQALADAASLREGILPAHERVKADNQRLSTELAQIKESRSLAESRADALVQALEGMLTNPDETAAAESFFRMRDDYPSLRSKQEVEYWKAEASRAKPETVPAAKADATASPAAPVQGSLPSSKEALETTDGHVANYKVEHAYRDVTEADWKQFEAACERTPLAFIRAATPEDAKQYGVAVGEAVYDTDLLHAALTDYVTKLRQSRETAETRERRAADAARRTTPKVDAPPVPGTTRQPPKAGPTTGSFTSKQEVENWLDSDEI